MNIILLILSGLAAGGVAKALYEALLQAKEREKRQKALKDFEKEHPGV